MISERARIGGMGERERSLRLVG
jgi:hypothetical protein